MKSRKELLLDEIETYRTMISKAERKVEEANTRLERDMYKNQIKHYNNQIEMDKKEIEELTRRENIDCLSGIDKLKAVQWYLREDKGFLLSDGGFQILNVKIDEDDDVVIEVESGGEIVVNIDKLFDKMLNEKRRTKIQKLIALILESIRRIDELAYDWEIESIRDTVLEAF